MSESQFADNFLPAFAINMSKDESIVGLLHHSWKKH